MSRTVKPTTGGIHVELGLEMSGPGLADRELDADRRAAAQRTPRLGGAYPSRQLGVGRALRLCPAETLERFGGAGTR